jgi:hypothetical protein
MRLRARHTRLYGWALLLPLMNLPAAAQGLNLGINLGGINVGVGVGTPGGTGVNVGVGGTSVGVNLGGGSGGDGSGGAAASTILTLTQQEALDAVANKKVMPLDKVLVAARLFTDGEIIDANLISVNGFLLYAFKVLASSGDVSTIYYYARSGVRVETK